MDTEPPVWVSLLTTACGTAAAIWGLWCTVIAFIGGTMPLIGLEVEGSFLGGIAMLLIGEPILFTLARFATMILLLPIIALTTRKAS